MRANPRQTRVGKFIFPPPFAPAEPGFRVPLGDGLQGLATRPQFCFRGGDPPPPPVRGTPSPCTPCFSSHGGCRGQSPLPGVAGGVHPPFFFPTLEGSGSHPGLGAGVASLTCFSGDGLPSPEARPRGGREARLSPREWGKRARSTPRPSARRFRPLHSF